MKIGVLHICLCGALLFFSHLGSCTPDMRASSGNSSVAAIPATSVAAYTPLDSVIFDKYNRAKLAETHLDSAVFRSAMIGYWNLEAKKKVHIPILTIVDFNIPSTENRMWILDLEKDSLLLHTWSAHGVGSGTVSADIFSNTPGSLQTSLGFYLTAEEYVGKNGRSLRIDGMDAGFNSNARRRYVVMHGADYVSRDTIDAYGYLGNSEGCPAVSHDVNHQVIDWVKGGSVLFITGKYDGYHSIWLDEEVAWQAVSAVTSSLP